LKNVCSRFGSPSAASQPSAMSAQRLLRRVDRPDAQAVDGEAAALVPVGEVLADLLRRDDLGAVALLDRAAAAVQVKCGAVSGVPAFARGLDRVDRDLEVLPA
jgi:hypothetical protein